MSVRLSCPSCNTAFALDSLPDHRRAQCPRCGDVFPVRGTGESNPGLAVGSEATPIPTPQPPIAPAQSRKPLVAFAAAVVLVLAAVAFWLSGRFVRNLPPSDQPSPNAPSATATPPSQLVGLGYLPPECNVVFAVQPGPLLAEAARTKQQPRDVLARVGLPEQVLAALDGTGVPLAHIDHIAGGLYLSDSGGSELRAALVLVLRQPVADEEAFRSAMKARPVAKKPDRWTVALDKVPLAPLLARVSPAVWVFGLVDKDFAPAEKGGFGPGGAHFTSTGLRKMIASVPPEAAVWVAADDERDWTQKPLVKLLTNSPDGKKLLPALAVGRGGMVAITFGEKPRMAVLVRVADTATADRVRAYFQARAAETEGVKSESPSTTEAQYEGPFDAKVLQRFLADAK